MSDQLKEILQKNLKINLIELEEKTHMVSTRMKMIFSNLLKLMKIYFLGSPENS